MQKRNWGVLSVVRLATVTPSLTASAAYEKPGAVAGAAAAAFKAATAPRPTTPP